MEVFLEKQARAYGERHETYGETKTRKTQLDLVRRYDGDEAASQFILDNLRYDDFRTMAIDAAMQRRDYQAVLSLAREGIQKNGRVGGSSWRWQQHEFDAYRAMENLPCARGLARGFLMNGRFEYYEWLKESAEEGEWGEEAQCLSAEMEARRFPGVV